MKGAAPPMGMVHICMKMRAGMLTQYTNWLRQSAMVGARMRRRSATRPRNMMPKTVRRAEKMPDMVFPLS